MRQAGPPTEGWLSAGGRPDDDPDGRLMVTAAPPRQARRQRPPAPRSRIPRLRPFAERDESVPWPWRPTGRQVTVRCGPPPQRPAAIPVSSGSFLTQWPKSSIPAGDCATI